MEPLDAPAGFMDELLDFSSDIGEEEEEDDDESNKSKTLSSLPLSLLSSRGVKTSGMIVEEEELEWISNKDAFPMVESFVDIMPNHHHQPSINNHQSPVSVLENSSSSFNSNTSSGGTTTTTTTTTMGPTMSIVSFSSNFKVPVKARSKKRKRRRELFGGQQWQCWPKETHKISKQRERAKHSSTLGRKCLHCQTEKTPQWRAGPLGPKTLCNACGVRYKSGRLVPEYRPASSPTFSSEVHSNSHRKIIEMRKQGQVVKPGAGSMMKASSDIG